MTTKYGIKKIKTSCYFCGAPAMGIISINNKTDQQHQIGAVILEPHSVTELGVCYKCVQEIEPTN